MTPRLQKRYNEEIAPELMKALNFRNRMQVPCIRKIVVNVGMGEGAEDIKKLEAVAGELERITGQHAVITRARKAVSNFKIRKGSPVGCKVTLRQARMYEFLDRLINVALPSLKDFRGISNRSFDRANNYTLGLQEQTIFPEIEYDKVPKIHGMDITIVTSAKSRMEAIELIRMMGMPFKK